MLVLGLDLGSSSVKVTILDAEQGKNLASAQYPKDEQKIDAPQAGWAEQSPQMWWENMTLGLRDAVAEAGVDAQDIKAIGISYQMHGLVVVDEKLEVLRPSIIWCDGRAVPYGQAAYDKIGHDTSLKELLNSPGNFTAAKLAWVKDNEPELYNKIHKIMLPGDFFAMKLSGKVTTTATGLSEGVFWDYSKEEVSEKVLNAFDFDRALIPEIVPAIGEQVKVSAEAAQELGLPEGIPVTYRAGDQPNNALSLNVFHPGEIAATAGTSAVIYAVTEENAFDPQSRVNTFIHVNNTAEQKRNGVLLCVNGSGILYQWVRKLMQLEGKTPSYKQLNDMAANIPIGADGLRFYPFGNGAERILNNKDIEASLGGLNFNIHTQEHMVRAAKEGIVFALNYGFEIMSQMGLNSKVVRAGQANLFLSPMFREAFVNTTGTNLEIYDTNGADGAARAAALGAGYYADEKEAFASLECQLKMSPDADKQAKYKAAYESWKEGLQKLI